jgi:hypothetical protein
MRRKESQVPRLVREKDSHLLFCREEACIHGASFCKDKQHRGSKRRENSFQTVCTGSVISLQKHTTTRKLFERGQALLVRQTAR